MEDNFLKEKDYLVQLALKLFSITPHAAGCERVCLHSELPYYCIGKSNEKVHDIIVDAHLNLDDDLIETMEEEYVDSNTDVFDESNELILSNVLNLDAEVFINSLDEIIEDNENSMEEKYVDIQDVDEMIENEYDIDWDPATEADEIIDSM
ncbi:hypothetical protein RclHR1_01150025 [Rhizophagus clarus]|uniref:HAT C-terminal dimerisation domain-containing protein n=1 Tax=Rhizophagus clarus TaxID=94130 RepID=A0A2Z6QJJ4_9GLOM|nr:hypothetical protein RclHR1_01150025 [Rhizophagus clarus]